MNTRNALFGTPICVAALRRHRSVVDILLKHKAEVSMADSEVLGSAMHCAFFGGSIYIVRSLLRRGADVDLRSIVSVTALAKMANDRLLATKINMSLLLQKDWNEEDGCHRVKCSPVLLAADQRRFELLRCCWSGSLTENPGQEDADHIASCSPDETWEHADEPSARLRRRSQSLCIVSFDSAGFGSVRSGRSYMSKASNASRASSAWSFMGFPQPIPAPPTPTLLMWAASSLNLDLINHLLQVGATVNKMDVSGRTALHYAASPFTHATFKDVGACVQRLVQKGASCPAITEDMPAERLGQTPLMLTINPNHAALDPHISRQPELGADIHAKCVAAFLDTIPSDHERRVSSRTALMYALASKIDALQTFELFCQDGAATDKTDQCIPHWQVYSLSALYMALHSHASEDVISLLLRHGANPNFLASNVEDDTALTIAIEEECPRNVIQILLEHGADPDMENSAGVTPIQLAKERGRRDLIHHFATWDQKDPPIEHSPMPTIFRAFMFGT